MSLTGTVDGICKIENIRWRDIKGKPEELLALLQFLINPIRRPSPQYRDLKKYL